MKPSDVSQFSHNFFGLGKREGEARGDLSLEVKPAKWAASKLRFANN